MQRYHCIRAQHFDLAQFLDSDALPLQGKVEKIDPQFTDYRIIPWKVLLFQPLDVMLSCITISCAVISCNCISPILPVPIFAVSAKTYVKRFQSRLRPYCARHKTKPCKTQFLSPVGWMLQRKSRQRVGRQSRGAEMVCGSFPAFWQVTPLNSATSTLPLSDGVLRCITCVWETGQGLETQNGKGLCGCSTEALCYLNLSVFGLWTGI